MWLIIVFQFCSWVAWQALHFKTLNSYSNWISECQVGVSSVLRMFWKVHWIWMTKLFSCFFFVRKGLMAKKWRQGHLLLKPNTEFDNTSRCWMLPFCALTMRLGALLLPRLQQEKMRLQQILNWITARIDWIICPCSGVLLRSSLCLCLACCCALFCVLQ